MLGAVSGAMDAASGILGGQVPGTPGGPAALVFYKGENLGAPGQSLAGAQAPEVLQCAVEATAGSFMLETDSPYLTPQARRGQRCEPAFVRQTAETIAAARGVTLETLAHETSQRARDFFGL